MVSDPGAKAPTWHSILTWYIVEHSTQTEKQAEKKPKMTSLTNRNIRDFTEIQTPQRHITLESMLQTPQPL